MSKRSIATEYQLRKSFQAFNPKPSRVVCRRKVDKENRTSFILAIVTALVCSIGPMVAACLTK